jgi:hypothetical protein
VLALHFAEYAIKAPRHVLYCGSLEESASLFRALDSRKDGWSPLSAGRQFAGSQKVQAIGASWTIVKEAHLKGRRHSVDVECCVLILHNLQN